MTPLEILLAESVNFEKPKKTCFSCKNWFYFQEVSGINRPLDWLAGNDLLRYLEKTNT